MPDNVKVQAGIGDDSQAPPIATDLIGLQHYQKIKVGWGSDGTWAETADADGVRVPIGGAQIGLLNETAPASDTAPSGLNGRLQRLAQRLTSLIALVPGSLGQKPMATSFAVAIASDQSVIPSSQSGVWTVQPGNTPNTVAWKVDGSAVVQPVSGTVTANAGTGASTAALGPATAADVGDEATTDEALASPIANLRLIGFSARETAGSGSAVFNIRSGATNAGPILVTVSLGPGESAREWYGPDGIASPTGLWLERVSGTTQVTGYWKVVP